MKAIKRLISLLGLSVILLLFANGCEENSGDAIPQNSPPTISDQSFSVAEGIGDEEVIGLVQASDPDGDTLSFTITEIVDANDNRDFSGLFEIDAETGALSLSDGESLDFEEATGFSVTVSVSDMELTVTASIAITVTDVEETIFEGPFITTWRTTVADETIRFFIVQGLTYDFNVDWGDGTIQNNLRESPSHTYATPGDYQVAITGTFPAIRTIGAKQIISIDQWGGIEWENMERAFISLPKERRSAANGSTESASAGSSD